MNIDTSTEFGQRVSRRLNAETIIWLTTTGATGMPQPRPVWFLWRGDSFLIFSRPNTAKLAHIASNGQVALNLDGNGKGGDIIVFTGQAKINKSMSSADQVGDYVKKYAAGIEGLGMTPVEFGERYSVAIEIVPNHLRGH